MKNYIAIIIFVIFFISIVSIIAIFIARGYNFTGTHLQETGILEITSDPQDAVIFVNGEEKASTPKKIDLISGTYEITIQKDTFTTWKKEIFVEPQITTQIQATLFPKKRTLEQITFMDIDTVFFSKNGEIGLYIVSSKQNHGIWIAKFEKNIFDLSQSQFRKIVEFKQISKNCPKISNYSINIAHDNTRAILSCNNEKFIHFYLIDLRQGQESLLHINNEIDFNPDNVDFGITNDHLLIYDKSFVGNFNTSTKELTIVTTIEKGYEPLITHLGEKLLVLSYNYDHSQRNLWEINTRFEKQNITSLDTTFEETRNISASIINSRFLALSDEDNSYLYEFDTKAQLKRIFSKKSVELKDWSPDGTAFFFKEGNKMNSAVIRTYPNGTIKVFTYTILNNFSPNNHFLKWSPDSEKILIHDKKREKVYVLDKDGKNKTVLYKGALSAPHAFQLSKNETFLILLLKDDQKSSNLYSIKLKV